jgi:AraC-like DNA-binding protein
MLSTTPPFGSVRFSTESLPPRDRMTIWREIYGRSVIRIDITPLGETPFRVDADIHTFPDLTLAAIKTSPSQGERTRELARECEESVGLLIPLDAEATFSQRNKEMKLGCGDAALLHYDCPGSACFSATTQFLEIRIPTAVLTPAICDSNFLPTVVPAGSPVLRLLREYVCLINENDHLVSNESRHTIAAHIHDLAALTIGATRDATAIAAERGVRAARLCAIKNDIGVNLRRRGLSLNAVAARHGISPIYVRKLFNDEGTTFSAFVLDARLARAHCMLSDRRFIDRTISTIAFECGFGDLSYFNRAFRRRYQASPSEIRDLSRAQ